MQTNIHTVRQTGKEQEKLGVFVNEIELKKKKVNKRTFCLLPL